MAVTSLKDIVDRAFADRYGVPAINVFNDLTMEAALAGAVEAKSPIIVQTSVKTVRSVGSGVLMAQWKAMTSGIEVPCALHLDHCPDRAVITECLDAGWNSVLFDASELTVEENQAQTVEVVEEAREHGAHVEGEIESITGVEDGVGSDTPSERQSLDVQVRYLEATGVDVFAPAIGNAHGSYSSAPDLDTQRVSDIVERYRVPIALHGGSGLSDDVFKDLISRGCGKVNISTALKELFMKQSLEFLRGAEEKGKWDPPALFKDVRGHVVDMTTGLCSQFGSAGKA